MVKNEIQWIKFQEYMKENNLSKDQVWELINNNILLEYEPSEMDLQEGDDLWVRINTPSHYC